MREHSAEVRLVDDEQMVQALASRGGDTGDGLRMAMRVGAALGTMREAWWVPIIDVRRPDGRLVAWQVNGERTRPHCIMVNRKGRRFTNEAANYNALGAAFHVVDVTDFDYANLPAWLMFDQHYLERYGLAGYRGFGELPSWITSAPDLAALAGALGLPEQGLLATVREWNTYAVAGEDPDFGRGRSLHDRWWGDTTAGVGAASTLGPLDTAPQATPRP